MRGGDSWRESEAARACVLAYCLGLRAALRMHPRARRYLRRCALCRLFFLADYRNAGREHVCCPYGCRPMWQRQCSDERVAKYYDKPEGREKKRALNRRRNRQGASAKPKPTPKPEPMPPPPPDEDVSSEIITHLQFVVGLFEERRVGRDEIVTLLRRIWRQHKIGPGPSRGYGALQKRRTSRGS